MMKVQKVGWSVAGTVGSGDLQRFRLAPPSDSLGLKHTTVIIPPKRKPEYHEKRHRPATTRKILQSKHLVI
jgi:hypothetical protein